MNDDIVCSAGRDIVREMRAQLALGKDPVVMTWTIEEARRFLDAVENDRHEEMR